MFQTSVIASGSKGNCVLIRSPKTAILLDAGIAFRRIREAMEELGVLPSQLAAVILSHEHSDHSRGVGAVSRSLGIPLYTTEDTYYTAINKLGNLKGRLQFFASGSAFRIGDIHIHPFASSHDAIDSCNFTFSCEVKPEAKLGVATDLGYATNLCLHHLRDCSTLILESNHDEQMLHDGPYDWHLKKRIKSRHGHLSNVQAVGLLSQLKIHKLKNLILAHLSEINNTPDLAHKTMQEYLNQIRSDINLLVAEQDCHTPLIEV